MREFFEQLYIKRILRYALYMFLCLVAQNMLFTQIRPFGVCPLLLPTAVVAVGMFEGATWGWIFGLIMGIFADMAFVENTIMFTLMFPLLGFFAGFVSQFFINRRFFAYMGLALAASLFTALIQMLATFAGDAWSGELIKTAVLQTLLSMPTAVLAYFPPAKWID